MLGLSQVLIYVAIAIGLAAIAKVEQRKNDIVHLLGKFAPTPLLIEENPKR